MLTVIAGGRRFEHVALMIELDFGLALIHNVVSTYCHFSNTSALVIQTFA